MFRAYLQGYVMRSASQHEGTRTAELGLSACCLLMRTGHAGKGRACSPQRDVAQSHHGRGQLRTHHLGDGPANAKRKRADSNQLGRQGFRDAAQTQQTRPAHMSPSISKLMSCNNTQFLRDTAPPMCHRPLLSIEPAPRLQVQPFKLLGICVSGSANHQALAALGGQSGLGSDLHMMIAMESPGHLGGPMPELLARADTAAANLADGSAPTLGRAGSSGLLSSAMGCTAWLRAMPTVAERLIIKAMVLNYGRSGSRGAKQGP